MRACGSISRWLSFGRNRWWWIDRLRNRDTFFLPSRSVENRFIFFFINFQISDFGIKKSFFFEEDSYSVERKCTNE